MKTSCSSRITSARCQPLELSSLQARGLLDTHPSHSLSQGPQQLPSPNLGALVILDSFLAMHFSPKWGMAPAVRLGLPSPAEPQSGRGMGLCQLKQGLSQKLMVQEPHPVQVDIRATDPAPAPEPCTAGFLLGWWQRCQVRGCWCRELEAGAEHSQAKGLLSPLSRAQ